MSAKILLIDDALDDQEIIRSILGKQYSLTVAGTLAEARACLEKSSFDLIILDVQLPDGNGFQFCAVLKNSDATKDVPVLFLTIKSDVPDRVMGFALGADDYIPKPFHPSELRARVDARMKKVVDRQNSEMTLSKGDLRLNISLQRVSIHNGETDIAVDLTPLEFKLLFYLAQHEDQVFSRDQLITAAWGESVHVLDRTVDMHVSHLRRKLSLSMYTIKAVQGVGYRLTRER